MGSSAILIVVAVIGGISVALQAQMMGLLDKSIGTLEGVFVTYAGGGLLIALILIFMRGGNLGAWQSVPWYAYSSGALGLVIVGAIGYSAPRLGLVATFTIIVSAQFVVAALIDHFGILGAATRPLDLSRMLGIALLLAGIWLTMR
ncbi:MAG: DMT family transporter [Deltaproteobacteria bacterium]|nr:DMT family transporter [Deltaproteobacteria bacterium]MBW2483598.1 DMT family transporter [Deltaproteobacteria bacterium]